MTPEVSNTCMFLTTTKEIWDFIHQTYSKVCDAAQIFSIKTRISATKQGNLSVTEYSLVLKILWQEMDHYQCVEMKCSNDAALYRRLLEKDRICEFLTGLNMEYDPVRVQVLGNELPTLNQTVDIIQAEEGRRGVMVDQQPPPLDGSSALVTKSAPLNLDTKEQLKGNELSDLIEQGSKENWCCTFCKKPCHTKDHCWKLNGKPPPFQNSNKNWNTKGEQQRKLKGVAHLMVQSPTEEGAASSGHSEFNKAVIEQLKAMLCSLEKSTVSDGNCPLALCGTGYGEDVWTC